MILYDLKRRYWQWELSLPFWLGTWVWDCASLPVAKERPRDFSGGVLIMEVAILLNCITVRSYLFLSTGLETPAMCSRREDCAAREITFHGCHDRWLQSSYTSSQTRKQLSTYCIPFQISLCIDRSVIFLIVSDDETTVFAVLGICVLEGPWKI